MSIYMFLLKWVVNTCIYMSVSFLFDITFNLELNFAKSLCMGVVVGLAVERKGLFELWRGIRNKDK
ncbi:hypothetical protein [Bacillus sp. NEAU-Y102]